MAKQVNRDDDLSEKPAIKKKLLKHYDAIVKGFADQRPRSNDNLDYWDMYNCQLGHRQVYNGNSQIFLPFVRGAITARKTRFVNQLFPQSQRHVEAVTTDGEIPHASISLSEHYIETSKLRTEVVPALMVSGDVEGSYHVYVDWAETEREVIWRQTKAVTAQGIEMPDLGEVETIEMEEVVDSGPCVEVLADADVLILPATSESVAKALKKGGSVTVIRRWTTGQIDDAAKEGEITEDAAEALKMGMSKIGADAQVDTAKNLADAAGIKTQGDRRYLLLYETWLMLKVRGKMRLCVARYGGDNIIMSCRLNPFWCDKCPVISRPLQKVPGVMKGMSMVGPGVRDLQVLANDIVNEMADLGHFTVFPIIMTDPTKNPNYASMVMDLMAVWETDPNSTKALPLPDTAQQCLQKIAAIKQEIFQALSVSPAMLPQQTGGKMGAKRNQAEVALEQQVDILTTADAATVVEDLLTEVVQRFIEYDHQFREDAILVRSFGELGLRAIMEEIPPQQMNRRWTLIWNGVEAARNAQQVQQQIAAVNVLRGIPEQLYGGHKLDISPVLSLLVENIFGPRLAPIMFKPARDQMTVDPKVENALLEQGMPVSVNPGDDDAKHLQVHAPLAQNDMSGHARVHIAMHQKQLQEKQKLMMMQAMMPQGGQQGVPGAAGQPGVAGTPRPGSQPAQPKLMRGPPGAIGNQQMPAAGAVPMPRRM